MLVYSPLIYTKLIIIISIEKNMLFKPCFNYITLWIRRCVLHIMLLKMYLILYDIVKSEQLDQLPLFVINEVEKSIFRCYQLKYFLK